jgi:hypothetical protein
MSDLWTFRFPCYTWEATYRREEREQRRLTERPSIEPPAVPRAVALSTANRLLARLRPESGEIIACWARPT